MFGTSLLAFLALEVLGDPHALRPDIQIRHVLDTGGDGGSIRLARDPTDGGLYFLRADGGIHRVSLAGGDASTSIRVYSAADTGVVSPAALAFGPEGTLYLSGNEAQGPYNVATVRKGARLKENSDPRAWSTLAVTAPYPRSKTSFDHTINGMAVDPDGRYVFLNSGSRTDHGEVQDQEGAFLGLREVPLTSCILRLPAQGRNLVLPDDQAALVSRGYLFADGVRNSYDLAFSPRGELFAADNSGDRDDPDELNWIQEGRHYGFPWRMGTQDTPQRFPGYDPEKDLLLNHLYTAYRIGAFHDDPSFPPPPALPFTDPLLSLGPDADSFRDPESGEALDASERGLSLGTFSAHRSPLGLVFDVEGALSAEFRGHGFILSWTRGDAAGDGSTGPFRDAGEDLLHLELLKANGGYLVRVQRLAGGFDHPIDAELLGNRLYVLEHGGRGALWEVTLPSRPLGPELVRGRVNSDGELDLSDAVGILFHLLLGNPAGCLDAADSDDDGSLSVGDAVYLIQYLFLAGAPPPPPFAACGTDPTPDAGGGDLGCLSPPGCG